MIFLKYKVGPLLVWEMLHVVWKKASVCRTMVSRLPCYVFDIWMLKIRNTNQPEPADHGEGEGDGGDDGREEEARAHPVRLTQARNWILDQIE